MKAVSGAVLGLGNLLYGLIAIMLVTGGGFIPIGKIKIEFASPEVFAIVLLVLGLVWTKALKRSVQDWGWTGRTWRILEEALTPAARGVSPGTAVSSRAITATFIAVTFCILWITHVLRHLALRNHGCDVSMVHQALFYPWGTPPLRADFSRMGTALSEHVVYDFFLLAPFTSILKSNIVIYALQALLLGVPTVFLVTRGPLKKLPGAMLVGAVLLLGYKCFRNSVVWDFREDVIAYAGLVGMILSLSGRRLGLFAASFLITLLAKENLFAITLLFAVPVLFSKEFPLDQRERRVLALGLVLASLAYGVLAFKVLIPLYTNHDQGHALFSRYGEYGHSVSEIAMNILVTPRIWWQLLSEIFDSTGAKYLLFLFLPIVPFLFSREALIWLVPASAGVLMNVGHHYHIQRMMIFHYELIILPFLFLIALAGIRDSVQAGRPNRALLALAFGLCVFGRPPFFELRENWPSLRDFKASRLLGSLNYSERVAVDERLSAQVNHLPKLRIISWIPAATAGDEEIQRWFVKAVGPEARIWIADQDNPVEARLLRYWLGHGAKSLRGELGASRVEIIELPVLNP